MKHKTYSIKHGAGRLKQASCFMFHASGNAGFTLLLENGMMPRAFLDKKVFKTTANNHPESSPLPRRRKNVMPFFSTGFTLVEMLVSIAVIVMLSTIIWRGLSSFSEAYGLNHGISATLGLIKDARTRTLASEGARQYGVHFEETQAVLFWGASFNPANVLVTLIMPVLVRISSVDLAGGGQDIVFGRLTGATAQPGTIEFETKRSETHKTIQVLSSGLFEAQ
ncbi:MAG: prepilin-type N-terminal cleavage/methylation domain-containing protein [bacterium]|nr:prepilin-type N-terminal cleavage/methylation domain-containing protein [bacterium]